MDTPVCDRQELTRILNYYKQVNIFPTNPIINIIQMNIQTELWYYKNL